MPAPAALLDECLALALVPALAQQDFDVASLLTVGPRGISDALVLERAAELGRVLITQTIAMGWPAAVRKGTGQRPCQA